MDKKISEIFDYGDEIEVAEKPLFDPKEIKEITMKKISDSQSNRSKKSGKRILIAAVAAVMVLTLTVGAAAAGKPIWGYIFNLFRGTDGDIQNIKETQSYVQENAYPIENAEGKAADGEMSVSVSVTESYYDGYYLYAGLELEAKEDLGDTVLYGGSEDFDILINGESQRDTEYHILKNDEGFVYFGLQPGGLWELAENGKFITQIAFRVPEKYRAEDSLDIGFHFAEITAGRADEEGIIVNDTPFDVAFTAKKSANVKESVIEAKDLEMGGVRFVKAVATPVGVEFTFDYPAYCMNPATGAVFEDGEALGAQGDSMKAALDDSSYRFTRIFAGLSAEESREVIYTVCDKNGSGEYIAVFVLDFQNGTVRLGTESDIPDTAAK